MYFAVCLGMRWLLPRLLQQQQNAPSVLHRVACCVLSGLPQKRQAALEAVANGRIQVNGDPASVPLPLQGDLTLYSMVRPFAAPIPPELQGAPCFSRFARV